MLKKIVSPPIKIYLPLNKQTPKKFPHNPGKNLDSRSRIQILFIESENYEMKLTSGVC